MSLQLAAQHMASRGRGPDNTLVHMAPQEVAGLQALAMAHGGSLTINPDTGLPEAGFLSNILPTVIGAGLSIASGGTLTPLMAAGITGAGYGVATGSLKKGLLAGLGAYGGAGLAGSVVGTGTGALSSAAGSAAANAVTPVTAVVPEAIVPAATEGLASATTPTLGSTVANPTGIPGFQGTNLGLTPTPSAINAAQAVTQAVPTVTQAPVLSQQAADIGNIYAQEQAAQNAVAKQLAETTPMGTAKAGLSAIMDKPELLFNKGNMKYGLAAAAPLLFQEQEKKARKEEKPYEYTFDYNRVENPSAGYTGPYTGERTYFNPTFTRTAAGGGLMDIGPVEAMSNRNETETLMANGGQMFAEGGETKAVGKVEDNPYYTMTGQSGDAFKYLMGQGPKAAPAAAVVPAAAAPAVVATPASLASATGDLANSYVFNPSTGTFASIGTTTANTSPATAAQYYSAGSDSPNTGVTPQQAAVFDFMNTDAGRSYKDMYGAANSSLIGSLVPGSMVLGAIKGEFTNPFTAFRDAQAAYSLAERAMQAQQSAPVESMGGTVSGFSNADPGGMFGGAQSGDVGFAYGGLAALAGGGMSHLGDYSDGGRLLRGPGDGVSDSIPASIGNKRPARLADGEFVVSADVVSGLGNGSTEAGARKLYAMMDRVRKARTGTKKMGKTVNPDKLVPA